MCPTQTPWPIIFYTPCSVSVQSRSTGSLSSRYEHYNYGAYLETLFTYGTDAASSHLSNSYWNLDNWDMNPCGPMAQTHTSAKNGGFIARWARNSGCRDVQIYGRVHTDLCNVPLFLLPRVQLKITLKNALPSFYLMNKTAYTKTTLKFLDSYLMVRRVQPNPLILLAHESALTEGALAWYNKRESTSRLLHFRPGLNLSLLTMQCWAPFRNVCCSP